MKSDFNKVKKNTNTNTNDGEVGTHLKADLFNNYNVLVSCRIPYFVRILVANIIFE